MISIDGAPQPIMMRPAAAKPIRVIIMVLLKSKVSPYRQRQELARRIARTWPTLPSSTPIESRSPDYGDQLGRPVQPMA